MPEDEPNGSYDWRENMRELNQAMRLNYEEHDRIWNSFGQLRDRVQETNTAVANIIGAIRDLIHRIPPENLR